MARFIFNGSKRADCFMRMQEEAQSLLVGEIKGKTNVAALANPDATWLSVVADVALVLGLSREDWLKAYDANRDYYDRAGIRME